MRIAQLTNHNKGKFNLTPPNQRVRATFWLLHFVYYWSLSLLFVFFLSFVFCKCFLPLNPCTLFISFDNCVHGGFPCSSCTALCLFSSNEGAKIWFSGYYKCQISPKKSLFSFLLGASMLRWGAIALNLSRKAL